MNARAQNDSTRALFFNGGRLDVLFQDEAAETESSAQTATQFRFVMELLGECPCGCGLKDDICETCQTATKAANDAIPF
jgi:hypothetical protein